MHLSGICSISDSILLWGNSWQILFGFSLKDQFCILSIFAYGLLCVSLWKYVFIWNSVQRPAWESIFQCVFTYVSSCMHKCVSVLICIYVCISMCQYTYLPLCVSDYQRVCMSVCLFVSLFITIFSLLISIRSLVFRNVCACGLVGIYISMYKSIHPSIYGKAMAYLYTQSLREIIRYS